MAEQKVNPMELWLDMYGTVDKDAEAKGYADSTRMKSREYIKNLKIDATIDLHGLTRDEAYRALSGFVNDCVRKNYKKILIVHGKGIHSGKGEPVIASMVKTFIQQNSHLGASGHADKTMGGSGATWVLIK